MKELYFASGVPKPVVDGAWLVSGSRPVEKPGAGNLREQKTTN
jgi:hypothetical protein